MQFPITENLALIRTSFADEKRWCDFLRVAQSPSDPFNAYFTVVDDRSFEGMSIEAVVEALPEGYLHSAVFIADDTALREEHFPCLVVGPLSEDVRSFRAFAREIASIDNNLSIANMGFEEFEEASKPSGVFRGFE